MFKRFYLLIWKKDSRAREYKWWARAEREGEEVGRRPWDHDLSWRQMLNWLSHPGTPGLIFLKRELKIINKWKGIPYSSKGTLSNTRCSFTQQIFTKDLLCTMQVIPQNIDNVTEILIYKPQITVVRTLTSGL